MSTKTKSQIQTHSDGFGRSSNPAINVKCRNFPCASDVSAKFKCSKETASKAIDFAYECACANFWEQVQEQADYHLGSGYKVYSEGRCSGWLVVHGMPDLESWDAIACAKWWRFEKVILGDIAYRCDVENVMTEIESNEWHKDGAEKYNFIDRKDGSTACIADLKAQAIAAGFACVVR
jgi:hypothetical protein